MGAGSERPARPGRQRAELTVEFLALAVGLIVLGVSVVLFRHRRPTGLNAGIDDFAARRDALAPSGPPRTRGQGTG